MKTMTEISKEYAEALFALAREEGKEAEFLAALRAINDEFLAFPEYSALLSAPNIPAEERRGLMEQAFAASVPEYVLSCVELLMDKGRLNLLGECLKEYEKLYQALCAMSKARVVSAVALTEDEKKALIAKLEKMTRRQVEASYEIDAAILGGVIVHLDDKVLDGSVRHKLKELKEVIGK